MSRVDFKPSLPVSAGGRSTGTANITRPNQTGDVVSINRMRFGSDEKPATETAEGGEGKTWLGQLWDTVMEKAKAFWNWITSFFKSSEEQNTDAGKADGVTGAAQNDGVVGDGTGKKDEVVTGAAQNDRVVGDGTGKKDEVVTGAAQNDGVVGDGTGKKDEVVTGAAQVDKPTESEALTRAKKLVGAPGGFRHWEACMTNIHPQVRRAMETEGDIGHKAHILGMIDGREDVIKNSTNPKTIQDTIDYLTKVIDGTLTDDGGKNISEAHRLPFKGSDHEKNPDSVAEVIVRTILEKKLTLLALAKDDATVAEYLKQKEIIA
jgi:hypothetical protein